MLRMLLLGGAGYALYHYMTKDRDAPAAFDASEADATEPGDVRNAGPDAMRDKPEDWDETDQALDESFPASDPPATY